MHCVFVQDKCYQYWPDQGCWTYGNIRVSVDDCIVLVDYTIRKFCVQSVRHNPCVPFMFEFFKQVVAKSNICLKEVRKIS